MSKLFAYSSALDQRTNNIQSWAPGYLRTIANNRNNYELEKAKKRVTKSRNYYYYDPSEAYKRFIGKKFSRQNNPTGLY